MEPSANPTRPVNAWVLLAASVVGAVMFVVFAVLLQRPWDALWGLSTLLMGVPIFIAPGTFAKPAKRAARQSSPKERALWATFYIGAVLFFVPIVITIGRALQ
mgnify:CR=1 FL=1|jgi:F0F1-type ATP synthase assembly protein I